MKLLCLILVFIISLSYGQISKFHPPEVVKADGIAIGENTSFVDYSEGALSPGLYDYDNDGDLDLFVGTYKKPRLIYFENIGTSIKPEFTEKGEVYRDNGLPIYSSNF